MIDLYNPLCKSQWCNTHIKNKYEGYCLYCYMHLFPDKPITTTYKTKERTIVDYIKNEFPNYDWIIDKIIKDGCSKRRPDMLLDLGYQILIIEIDENQHIDYDCSCENKRIMELSQDVNHRPIIFIRFNPDDYNKDNTKIVSCWIVNKSGCNIKKNKKEEWNNRLNTLKEQISYWISPNNKSNKIVEVIQLFYDE